MIFDLPEVIFYQIRDILTLNHEGNEFCVAEKNNNQLQGDETWRNFMNTTKLFHEIKRKTNYLILKDIFAFIYLRYERFRHRVDSLIVNKREQLHIIWKRKAKLESTAWDGCHTISIYSRTPDFSIFFNVKILRLHFCKNAILSNMMNLEALTLDQCDEIQEIRNCPTLTRLFARSCPKLISFSSDITNLTWLHVTDCPQFILQNRALLQVQHLWLDDKTKVYPCLSLHRLQNLKVLRLIGNTFVFNELWQLTNLTSLSLHSCRDIDIPRVPNYLKSLELSGCVNLNLPDLSEIATLRYLTFKDSNINEYLLDLPYRLNRLLFRRCLCLGSLYLHSSVRELVIDDSGDDGSNPSFDDEFLTLFIKKGVSMPKISMEVNLHVLIKID